MTPISSIKSLILDLPPSCIEFCLASPSCFVVGTYFLEKKGEDGSAIKSDGTQERTGSLIVFQLDDDDDEINQIQSTPTPYAVLDLHFSPHDPTLLCVAASTGLLQFFRFSPTTSSLNPERTIQLADPLTLVLSLAWHPTDPNLIGVTLSSGQIYLCHTNKPASPSADDDDTNSEVETTEIQRHDLEAWTLSFSPPSSGTCLFSGGDDATLRFSDSIISIPAAEEDEDEPSSAPKSQWSDRRAHTAGVTAILPLEHESDITITGSYDDHIRVLYTPKVGRKQVLAEQSLDGGVWRLKMLDEDCEMSRYIILASCMHAGTRIVEVRRQPAEGEQTWEINVLARFEEHKSMNYGSDVQPLRDGSATTPAAKTVISTSFYDKLLCLWRWKHEGASS